MGKFISAATKYMWATGIGFLIIALLAFRYLFPAPPSTLKIAASAPGSYFAKTAQLYQTELAKEGVKLEIVYTNGAAENLALLNAGKVDLALSHGGLTTPKDSPNLVSLGSLAYEPVWVFQRKGIKTINDLSQLKGLRVAIGKAGSGVGVIARKMLKLSGVDESNTTFIELDAEESEKQLLNAKIDVAFFMDPPESEKIHSFFTHDIINEVNLTDAEALRRHLRFLHVTKIPASMIDLNLEQPNGDMQTVSSTATLAANKNLHSAIQYLLMSVIDEAHHQPTLISEEDEFPADKDIDLPLSPEAEVFYKKGKPVLQRYLPFELASVVERLIKVILPILLLALPFIKLIPSFFNWSVKSKLFKCYRALIEVEKQVYQIGSRKSAREFEEMLNGIEEKINAEKIPLSFSNEVYVLREHIELARRQIYKYLETTKV